MERLANDLTLVLSPDPPLPATSGLRLRVLHLARELARDTAVRVAALGEADGAVDEPFELTGVPHRHRRVEALARSLRTPYATAVHRSPALAAAVASLEPQIVQVTYLWMLAAALRAGAPLVLDAPDVETELARSVAAQRPPGPGRWRMAWEADKTERFEARAARAARAVCATSDADADAFERMGAREVVVVPNGVDSRSVPWEPPPAGRRLLYVSYLAYEPNRRAARELAEEVLPRVRGRIPDAELWLVGRGAEGLSDLRRPGVELTGEIPSVLPQLRAARVTVMPLRSGSGTRLKVLEAMAAGVPVVATPLAVSGLGVRPGRHALIGDRPEELAELAVRVIEDDGLAVDLSRAGRALVEQSYDWSAVALPLRELHDRLRSDRRGL